MKRIAWVLPVLVGAVGCSTEGPSATYSADGQRPASPYSYTGSSHRTGSSVRRPALARTPQPANTAPPAAPYVAPPATPPAPPPPPPPAPSAEPAPAPAPTPPAPPAAPPLSTRAPLPTTPMDFSWAPSLREAQASARASGRLVFLETGRDECGNCQKLRHEIIPGTSADLGAVAVGYYDDCDRDPNSTAFQILRRNLPNAPMLPLVGWVTPELRWVHGFSGPTDPTRFRREIATARATYRQMSAVDRPAPASELAALPATPAAADPELLAPASPAAPAAPAGTTASRESAPAAAGDPASVEAWARSALARAADAMAARDYAAARSILSEVRTRADGLPEAREADKGEVAIYNLRRLEDASAAEATGIREQARRDLRDTVWARLFT